MMKKALFILLAIALLMSTMTLAISAKGYDNKDYVKPSYDKKWSNKNTHDNKWDNDHKWDYDYNKGNNNKGNNWDSNKDNKWNYDYNYNYDYNWDYNYSWSCDHTWNCGHTWNYSNDYKWDYNYCYDYNWNSNKWDYNKCDDNKWGYDKDWNGFYWCNDCCKGYCKSTCKYLTNYVPTDYLKYPRIIGTGKVEGYFVNYDCKGGSSILPTYYGHGALSTKPADPVRDGFKFGGWYADANCKIKPYEFDCRVTLGFTLYAKWIAA